MNKKKELFENIIVETQNVPWLTPLWSVIYNEAIRGNHLLFQKSDVATFDEAIEMTDSKTTGLILSTCARLESLTYELLCCSDLPQMVEIIDSENHQTKLYLYTFYQNVLGSLKNKFKTALN